jgi:F-type H+-transporting ATPase subunit a
MKINNIFTHINSPLDQFNIVDYISLDLPIFFNIRLAVTNITLYLIIGAFTSIILQLIATNYNKVISNRWSISQESLYSTIHSITTNQINNFKGQIFFPFIFTLFVFILVNNLIGMIPYSFASTSHFVLTFSLSFSVVLGATIIGFQKHGLVFFSLLVAAGFFLCVLHLQVFIVQAFMDLTGLINLTNSYFILQILGELMVNPQMHLIGHHEDILFTCIFGTNLKSINTLEIKVKKAIPYIKNNGELQPFSIFNKDIDINTLENKKIIYKLYPELLVMESDLIPSYQQRVFYSENILIHNKKPTVVMPRKEDYLLEKMEYVK